MTPITVKEKPEVDGDDARLRGFHLENAPVDDADAQVAVDNLRSAAGARSLEYAAVNHDVRACVECDGPRRAQPIDCAGNAQLAAGENRRRRRDFPVVSRADEGSPHA